MLVGPGGPFDDPNAPQRPNPIGLGPFGAYGFGRSNKPSEDLQGDDPDDSSEENRKGRK